MVFDLVDLYGNIATAYYSLNIREDSDYFKFVRQQSNKDMGYPFHSNGDTCVNAAISVNVDIVRGVLVVTCPICQRVSAVRRCSDFWYCAECNSGDFYVAVFRDDIDSVEKVLSERPNIINRNGYAHESLDDLIEENRNNL